VLDAHGALAEVHTFDHAVEPVTCSFDRDGALWAVTTLGNGVHVDGKPRDFAGATWAIRLTGAQRFVELFRGASTWPTAMPDGFAVVRYHESVMFVGRDGGRRWRLPVVDRGCSVSVDPITAAPDRLLAALHVLCEQRHGTAQLGDLTLEDRSEPDAELAERTVIAELDPVTGRTLGAFGLDHGALGMHYVAAAQGFVMYGSFEGDLGLGTRLRSGPDAYSCLSTLPTDARTWSAYETATPTCRDGFYLSTRQPSWPFVARFVLP
jgi:hypothetical protein